MNETQILALFVADTDYGKIPEPACQKAKACILDYLGSALYCSRADSTNIVSNFVESSGSEAQSTIIGRRWKTTAQYAALVNGTMGHGFELDDFHGNAFLHPGTVVIPAALATAEKENADGPRLLAAVVVGYEVMIRIGMALTVSHNFRGFHPTGTCGPFGAAAAAGKILGLKEEQLLNALGTAGSLSSGIKEFAVTGSMVKRYHAGKAAENGVVAAQLALGGLTGPASVLEGKFGFLQAFSDQYDLSLLTRELNRQWEIMNINVKPYACCGGLHSMIDGLLQIKRTQRIDPAKTSRIVVETIEKVALQNSGPGTASLMAAQYSIPFVAALTLYRNIEDPNVFTESILSDKEILALSRKVEVRDSIKNAGMEKSRVTVETGDGNTFAVDTDMPKGHPKNPLSDDEVKKKFRYLSRNFCGDDKTEEIIKKIDTLEKIKNLGEVSGLLQAD